MLNNIFPNQSYNKNILKYSFKIYRKKIGCISILIIYLEGKVAFSDRENQKIYSVRCSYRQFSIRLMILLNLPSEILSQSSSGTG